MSFFERVHSCHKELKQQLDGLQSTILDTRKRLERTRFLITEKWKDAEILKYKTGSSVLDWPACHCLDGETLCESCAVSTLTNAIHSCRAVLALQRVYEEVLEEYCAGRLQHEKDASAAAEEAQKKSVWAQQEQYEDERYLENLERGLSELRIQRSKKSMKATYASNTAKDYKVAPRVVQDLSNDKPFNLETERERIRAMVEEDSPFGRTGSYRGRGATALKPSRHWNSNAGFSNMEDQATSGKKPKKPALAR